MRGVIPFDPFGFECENLLTGEGLCRRPLPNSSDKGKFIMKNISRITSGEIQVILNEEDLILVPSIKAFNMINRQFDGLANARAALVRENSDAVVFVLRLGLNLSDRDARDLPDRVYKNGITAELLIPLIKYVAILGNGGRPLPDEPEDNVDVSGKDSDPNE